MTDIEYTSKDIQEAMEESIARIIKEGNGGWFGNSYNHQLQANDVNDSDDEDGDYNFIWDNNGIAVKVINSIGKCYKNFINCEIIDYSLFVDFDPAEVYIKVDENTGHLYVSEVKSVYCVNRRESIHFWKELSDFINRVNWLNVPLKQMGKEQPSENNAAQ